MMTKKQWSILAAVLAVSLVVATALIFRQANQPTDDCAVAADAVETWTSLSAELNAMVGAASGDKVAKAAEAEDAAAGDIRAKAAQISSPDIRVHAVGLADALTQIAEAQRSMHSSGSVDGADAAYMNGSSAAMASAAGLRKECPSIPGPTQ
jgi:hypothetical protein